MNENHSQKIYMLQHRPEMCVETHLGFHFISFGRFSSHYINFVSLWRFCARKKGAEAETSLIGYHTVLRYERDKLSSWLTCPKSNFSNCNLVCVVQEVFGPDVNLACWISLGVESRGVGFHRSRVIQHLFRGTCHIFCANTPNRVNADL